MSDEFFPRDNRQPRHFWADNEIIDQFGAQLGAHGIAVYMALARSAMNNSGECRTSMSKIGAQLNMSKGGVFNALTVILQLGLVRKTDDGDNRRCAAYVLADVKALTDPNHAQLRLSASVHMVNAESSERSLREPCVHTVTTGVHTVNPAFTGRTRNKEDKTLQDYKTKSKNITPSGALKKWLEIKSVLQSELPEADWIRPMYLFRELGDALGVTMPRSGEMIARAKSCTRLQELARDAGYSGVLITGYPADYQIEQMRVNFPDIYEALPDALKKRAAVRA